MAQHIVVTTSFMITAPDGTDADEARDAVSEQLSKSSYAGMLEDGETIERDPGTLFVHAALILPEHAAAAAAEALA